MDIKKILVPIDGSDASERAFSYAVAFAKKTAAEIILLYVVDADTLMYPVYRVSLAETDTASVKKKGGGHSCPVCTGCSGGCEGAPHRFHRRAGIVHYPHGGGGGG